MKANLKTKRNIKEKTKTNKGITLIALIITIIVLLILAGVSIATLTGDNGILKQAQDAREKTEDAEAKEREDLEKLNELIENSVNGGNNSAETVEVKVPEGFYQVEGTTVEGGLVISDQPNDDLNNSKGGNQYVWIPVDGILGENGTIIEDVKGTKGEKKILLGRYSFDSSGVPSVYSENFKEEDLGYGNTVAKDIQGFVDSVRENGGYYIARFEASEGSNNKVKSKYNKPVWNEITQLNAAIACQNLYSGVNSDLVNSYAWDTAILFIQKYGQNNYSRQNNFNAGSPINTGLSGDVQLNIYDMASNCIEWTTETSSLSGFPCVSRAGDYSDNLYYTSYRNNTSTTFSHSYYSFRSLLYF